ncbi:NAD(P)/FAD-dependent oxidoreductase [Azospirillum picis]|uniref:Thioredoxin reductase n=1 Tax=Azospirillum picis TaxID=488438 RepID=A0ABU0MVK6_9PROT|nr:NAD(P)/FAD-dependent oxidoreductase [Azospirillum picis]MBP2301872.1 thioredoxin reductase (NADPH) [Azospirillum picis]MDQ0537224.1 thioredoxin reductase (NADPH) [Azospirillum picis]
MDFEADCLIVGGGPAGLTAAIYLARYRRSVLVVDEAKSRCAWIPTSHNLAGFTGGISGTDLLQRIRAQAVLYGARIETASVTALERQPSGTGYRALLDDRRAVEAATVLLATGVIDGQPRMPYLYEAMQRGLIRVCPICDAFEVIDRRIAVLGHAGQAVGEARFIRGYSPAVTLLTLGEPMTLTLEERQGLDADGIAVVEDPVVAVGMDEDRSARVTLQGGRILVFDTLYSALGISARSALAGRIGAEMDVDGRLIVDRHQRSSVPGFYAAGDVVSTLNQIAVAMGEAAMAATAIHNDLRRQRPSS